MKLRLAVFFALLSAASLTFAQDDVDYKMEIGATAGGSFYNGDFNHKFYGQLGPAGGAIGRWLINPTMSIKGMLTYDAVKGSTDDVNDFYPPDPKASATSTTKRKYDFSDGVVDLSVTYEYNFWPYGLHHGYQGRQRLTPFIQVGMGCCYGLAGKAFTFQIPLGAGIKYKVKPRVNIGLDWLYHFSMSDKLDNVEYPYGVSSTGFKNKDNYCTTMFFITYEFLEKCDKCNRND